MADPSMPTDISQWIQQQAWGIHHLEWHVTRLWDARPDMRQFAIARGWSRAAVQEGAAGNGLEFLAMHRVMIRRLVSEFPQHVGLFRGWQTPPTDPNDASDPVPAGSPVGGVFNPDMLAAITRIENQPQFFGSDDEFGRYLETSRRPTAGNPAGISTDRTTGIHNYLHGRFSDSTSSIDMGDPQVNLLNQRFWRLHGWIDTQWSNYRESHGLMENDPSYQAALEEAEHHMGMHMGPMLAPIATRVAEKSARAPISPSAREALFSWGGNEGMTGAPKAATDTRAEGGAGQVKMTIPTWEGDAGQNNGVKDLFRPADVSCMKSPLVQQATGRTYALDDYTDVKTNAIKIYGMLKTQQMPPDGPWSNEMLLKFKGWMDAGCPER